VPVTVDRPAPYAPASAIMTLIERHRNKGLPSPVDSDVLARAGISTSLIPRTLQALQTLDLIEEDGRPTAILEGLRLAAEGDYPKKLSDWLKGAYADALIYVDPATDDETRVRDAFRSYNPVGQQARMVTLFMGLFAAAGIAPEKPKAPSRKPPRASQAPKVPTTKNRPTTSLNTVQSATPLRQTAHGELPPALQGLLASLPRYGQSWSKRDRDRFVHTFGAVLDFCFPVDDRQKQKTPEQEKNGWEGTDDPN
jgi:hypothetical protein